ncbi:hypothetical protein QAD02_010010 [Eretmocerus hayati]|uniref:Uncharacterized protein n=1 Tax=Eretmocerus hayati TaxID=131215 RepID=A0ACC2NB79_9HYME|nr:hypothetical protein QAD02_010010 [Eretmocerus hayati]
MKRIGSIVACFVVLLFVHSGLAIDMNVGARQDGDRMVLMDNVTVKASYFGSMKLEKEYQVPDGYTITHVKSMDQTDDGNGAQAVVVSGGPGTNKVVIRFQSRWWRGIYHRVEIYAKLNV